MFIVFYFPLQPKSPRPQKRGPVEARCRETETETPFANLRALKSAAPLKPSLAAITLSSSKLSPRPQKRGPVEAHRS